MYSRSCGLFQALASGVEKETVDRLKSDYEELVNENRVVLTRWLKGREIFFRETENKVKNLCEENDDFYVLETIFYLKEAEIEP